MNLYKDNYKDHIKSKNHLSEKQELIYKNKPLIINSITNLDSIKDIIIENIFN